MLDPNAPKVGLYKSTDSGLNFTLAYNNSASAAVNGWGVNHVEIDGHGDLYIAAEDEGIYRSKDGRNAARSSSQRRSTTASAAPSSR